MLDVLRFWLDRGVDGFRVDVLWHLIKDEQFRDNPPNPAWQPQQAGHRRLRPALHGRPAGGARRHRARCARLLDEYPTTAC